MSYNSKYTGAEVEALLDAANGKQDKITDLDTIREGAALGATALQSYTEKYTGTYSKPSGGIPKTDLASSVQTSLEKADTALQSYTEQYKGTVTGVKINNTTKNPSNGVVDLGTVITAHQDISGKADKSSLATVATSGSYNDLSNKPTIPAEQVNADWNATSGKAQILNKPTIPSAVTESTVSGWGFTKNAGTITGIKMNGASKGTSGVVDLGTVITAHQDISGKVDKVAGKGLSTNDFTDDDKDRLDDLIDWYPSADEDISYLMSNAAEIYKTEFDINDIYTIYSDQTSLVSCGKDKIVRAVKDGKVICVPYSKDDLFLGYIIADVTIEDLLYINLMGVNGDCFYISTDYQSGPSLFAEEITYYSFKDKQDKLVSGTNIKTVNGTSILGSGDIAISGGGGGTITGVYANGTSIATSGVANIPAASTSAYGVTKLSSATNSTSTTLAATASAVKSAYDLANSYKGTVTGVKINGTTKSPTSGTVDLGTVITSHQDISGKQDKLVSGTNIKTINGTSILGSGNITISGGSSGGGSGAYAQVNHGASDTTFTLTPNTFHVWDEISALTLSFGDETAGVANEFVFQFTSGSTATSLTLPDGIKWVNDTVPTISENKIYQISVLNNLAAALEFSNEVQLPVNRATWVEGDMMSGGTLTFQYPVASDLTITSMYTVVDTVIMAGETSVTIMWDEPMAPVPYSITPEKDNTYKYEL